MYPINLSDIHALKFANTVCVQTINGLTTIRTILRETKYTPEFTVVIPAEMRSTVYTDGQREGKVREAWGYISTSQYEPTLQTAIDIMRPGDILTAHWIVDNNSAAIESAGLHSDALELIVTRTSKLGKVRTFTFHILSGLCEDNSARMIQRVGL